MLHSLATLVIAATGLFFIWLAATCIFRPGTAEAFLLGFATSAAKHYAELGIRITVGTALVMFAQRSPWPVIINLFGWVLIGTTVGLLLVPWRWHHRFAQQAVPKALRYVKVLGIASFGLGIFFLVIAGHAFIG